MREKQQQIIEDYIKSYNYFDIDGMIQHLNPTITFENISDGKSNLKIEGIAAFRNQAETAKQYFQERRQRITSWEFSDNKIIIDIDYHAVLAVDFPNGMKAGDELKLKGQSEFEFNEDKIIGIKDRS